MSQARRIVTCYYYMRRKSKMLRRVASMLSMIVCWFLVFSLLGNSKQMGHALSVEGSRIVRDGRPYQVISGAMHYPRVPREYWVDRLKKARAMGLNTIETYVFWNMHEPKEGTFDFTGNLDVAEYVRLAQQEGLNVILRPGPYVCSEWDFGGLPAWLLADTEVKVRTRDPKFLAAADRYLMRVGQELASLQASRGGPIIMVQIENEYGSFGADKEYMAHIRDSLIRAGFGESILYTADGPNRLSDGTLPGVLAAANFGPGEAKSAFTALEKFQPGKPLMSGEYWDGWFDSWGEKHQRTDAQVQANELEWMLGHGYSVNLYMFHGGTTFGFMNGANFPAGPHKGYAPQTTSYDYDAPLDEAGRPTNKYFLFRDVIAHATKVAPPELPPAIPMITIPEIDPNESASLWENLPSPNFSERPKPMESYGQAYGYILYRTRIRGGRSGELAVGGMHDYASIYVNQKLVGELDRRLKQEQLKISIPPRESTLDILVENMGRINFGPSLQDDRKGITGTVTLDGEELTGWQVYSLPMLQPNGAKFTNGANTTGPAFWLGAFGLNSMGDTFLDVSNLHKGQVWVNGHNLGRVWDIGPQRSLCLPAPWLRVGGNEVIVFESSSSGPPKLRGVTEPIWSQ